VADVGRHVAAGKRRSARHLIWLEDARDVSHLLLGADDPEHADRLGERSWG
jgi:hypothetical protein